MYSDDLDQLAGLLRGSDTGAAIDAASVLGRHGGDLACDVLSAYLLEPGNPAVRVACVDALRVIAATVNPTIPHRWNTAPHLQAMLALVHAMTGKDPLVRRAAAEALAALDHEETMPHLRGLLRSTRVTRRAALHALMWLTVEYDDPEASVSEYDHLDGWGWWN